MRNRALHIILLLAGALALGGCYTNRYIPDGSHRLYNTVQTVAMADSSEVPPDVKEALKKSGNYYLQRRNSRVLGITWLPVGMRIYSIASPQDSTFWGNYWRRLGQAPVVYDEDKARRTAQQLQGLLESKGCFHSTVRLDTMEMRDKKITIGYHLSATPRYTIDEVGYHSASDTVRRLLDQWRDGSLLRSGDPYDQENLAAERARLVSNLRDAGFYYATTAHVSFVVDTTYHNRKLSIDVYVDSRDLRIYHINNIYIYPNSTAGLRSGESVFDTLIYNYAGLNRHFDYQFVYDKPMTLHPQTVSRAMMLFPGMTCRPQYVQNTYNSLLNLRNFKYINVEFSESPSSADTLPLLDAHVRLINATQQRLSLSLELTNASPLGTQDSGNFLSNGNLGVETSLEYQHKNLFGGAELLRVRSSLLLELPKLIFRGGNGSFYDNFNAFEISLDASLDMPTFLLPFMTNMLWQRTRPHTVVSLGGSYQYRYWFERILANTSFGYSWSQNRRAQHQLLPVELTFVRILNMDQTFAQRLSGLRDLRLKYQYSSHFIMDTRYTYAYSNQQYGTRSDFSLLRLSVESAGNLLRGLGTLAGLEADSNGVRQLFGVPFAQYVRAHGELTRYHYFGRRSTLVARVLLGMGIPYGNSVSMPYEKSFFGGGPTTMRAWQLRHMGPGSYNSGDNLLERVGDLQLVANLEGRFPIAGIFEGALFADMGNVWLFNASSDYPGGELRWDDFWKEIAVGVGLGLRVNVSVATLRLDFAIPLYDPGFDGRERWRLPRWSLRQVVANFGINYPF
ncbi:MAG: BamA/TamA family outer membrane protein [Bacteroidales bacterium]|nr:BamA/TamA family outer membrane protein [Bacteroidales bacterium]